VVGSVKYRTIVADPPWDVKAGPRSLHDPNERSRELSYPTMAVDAVAALPVADWAADAAHLYLWTINAYVEAAYSIARAWGFTPSTLLRLGDGVPKCRPTGATSSADDSDKASARRGALDSMDSGPPR
jgi:N6-adenosine-specific RNA methylase IME4